MYLEGCSLLHALIFLQIKKLSIFANPSIWRIWLLKEFLKNGKTDHKGRNISAGLNFLKDTGWVKYFPELSALIDCKQDPKWHPEGDVWVHTLHCMDAYARERIGEDWEDLVVGFGVLCHDLGKALTTKIGEDGRIRSPLHEPKGEAPTRSFLSRMTNQIDLHEQVVPLVRRHLTPRTFYKDKASDGAIRRLAKKVKRIDRLIRVASADIKGRPPRKDDFGRSLVDQTS